MGDVSHQGDREAGDFRPPLADGQNVEEALRRVLVRAIACVDDGAAQVLSEQMRRAGRAVPHHNGAMGRYRSTFDVHLTQKGTYKIAVTNTGVFARYKEDGRDKRWSGTLEAFAK